MEGGEFVQRVGGVVCSVCRVSICDCPRDNESAMRQGVCMRVDSIQNKEEFDRIIHELDLLYKCRPEDKYVLVVGLMEGNSNIVGVTGDGTGDPPVLKKANVGISMNISGTEVSK